MSDLVKHFHERFEILGADTQALREQAFRLRYQVYCVERQYEARTNFLDCCERDTFDDHSMHILVRDRRSGEDKATARLVTAGLTRDRLFPIEHSYPELLTKYGIDDNLLPRARCVEISRFAISKERRERAGDRNQRPVPTGAALDTRHQTLPGGAENRRPLVTFGLLLGLFRLGRVYDFTHCLAVMEPSLLRMLTRFGIRFIPIGPPVEYHGLRQPCYARVETLLSEIRVRQPGLWQLLADDDGPELPDEPQRLPPVELIPEGRGASVRQ
ncbi:MAG: PEP-CTERM/exosortase system-associated acyltransferase [Salinisphaera sp.]|nr:PEP-CTERM/exosortase system-associated acyltransferase [Salinisphaera sp.]